MSFSADLENDQDEPQVGEAQQGGTGLSVSSQSNQNQSDSGISLGGGGSGVASPTGGNVGGANQTAQAEASKPSSSGSWTNLQSYLDANADQGAQVGNQIVGNVSNQAKTAQDDVSSAAGDFTNNVNANTVNADPDAITQVFQDVTNLPAGQSLSDQDLQAYQKQANATYNGPIDFTKDAGYGRAQEDVNTAQSSLDQTGTEAGRDVLLQNQYQNASQNGYNQGEKNLDQLLLEGNPGNQQAFANVRNQWAGLSSALQNETAAENAAAENAVATDAATAAAAKQALDQANTSFQGKLNSKLTDTKSADDLAYNSLLSDIVNNHYSAADLSALGLTTGEHIYSADPSQFVSEASPTLYNVATADQYAQAQALAALAGNGAMSFLPSNDLSQAGTAGTPYQVNLPGLKNAISNGQNLAQAGYSQAWNSKQTVPGFSSPVSMADIQADLDQVAQSQLGADPGRTDPSKWLGSDGDYGRQLLQILNQWKDAHPEFPGVTISGGPAIQ